MKKSLPALVLMLLSFSAMAQQSLETQKFRCSDGKDYAVFISVVSGTTPSRKLLSFCTLAAGTSLQTCTDDNSSAAKSCYAEFKNLGYPGVAATK